VKAPIFIFSLPRSGSTLLQRILASHSDITTVAEPWVLLPFLYALNEKGAFSEYSHFEAATALHDFFIELPNGKKDYFTAVRLAVSYMYEQAMVEKSTTYFLDKTPRYSLVAQDVIQTFPNGKFIFLWRNPLAIAASIIETWGAGKWNLFYYYIDLYASMEHMLVAYQENKNKNLSINYELFLSNPHKELTRIGEYLGLHFDGAELDAFAGVNFFGRMGDQTGTKEFAALSNKPIEKWKESLANPWRKWWCRRYIKWLGDERLGIMGYNSETLIQEVNALPFSLKYFVSDITRAFFGMIYCWLSPTIFKQKWKLFVSNKKVVNHN